MTILCLVVRGVPKSGRDSTANPPLPQPYSDGQQINKCRSEQQLLCKDEGNAVSKFGGLLQGRESLISKYSGSFTKFHPDFLRLETTVHSTRSAVTKDPLQVTDEVLPRTKYPDSLLRFLNAVFASESQRILSNNNSKLDYYYHSIF